MSSENYRKNREKRHRRPGGGRKGQLSTEENQLFFILYYLKNYPTFDVLGFIFDLSPSKAEENKNKWLLVLKRAQSKLNVLPKRILKTGADLEEAIENVGTQPETDQKPAALSQKTDTEAKKKPDESKSATETAKTEPAICIDVTV